MISTYIWSLGQTNPMAKIKELLLNVSHPRTLNGQACQPIQIDATDIEDLYVTQDPLAIHLLEVDALNVKEDMDLLPLLKFLAHNTGRRLSQLEGRLAGNGCSLRSKFQPKEIQRRHEREEEFLFF